MSRRKQANPKSFKLTEDLKLSNNSSTNNLVNIIECKPDLEEIKIKIEPETR